MGTPTYIGKKILQLFEDNNDQQSYIRDWQQKLCYLDRAQTIEQVLNLDCDNKQKLAQSMGVNVLQLNAVALFLVQHTRGE